MKLYGIHTQETAQRIVDTFKTPEQLPKALAPVFIQRKDDTPCRKWSWCNQLLVALYGSVDARGFRQWESTGRRVKKGSKALWILAPCLKRVWQTNSQGEEVQRQILLGFRSVPVFRVEDTEGEPLAQTDRTWDDWITTLPLVEVAEIWQIHTGSYSGSENAPLGYYQHGLTGEAIMLGVANLSTWAHELVHAADHRLHPRGEDRWLKEVVAELGGAVLLECLGRQQDADLGGAFEYIERYACTANKPVVKACMGVLDRVCECVTLILDTAENLQSLQIPA